MSSSGTAGFLGRPRFRFVRSTKLGLLTSPPIHRGVSIGQSLSSSPSLSSVGSVEAVVSSLSHVSRSHVATLSSQPLLPHQWLLQRKIFCVLKILRLPTTWYCYTRYVQGSYQLLSFIWDKSIKLIKLNILCNGGRLSILNFACLLPGPP